MMMAKLAIFLGAATALAPFATLADSPGRCLPRDDILAALNANFAESPIGMGLQDEATVVEILRSPDGSSWTILQSFANGLSCVVASGTNWLAEAPVDLAGTLG
jgi:hypothetical protein